MPPKQRKAREAVLHALYEMDVGGHDPSESLERLIREYRLAGELEALARTLLTGVLERLPAIDDTIERAAPQRPMRELAAIDRNILRIAVRECIVDNLTPAGAAINEAVELAKKYGSESSGKFINGVLGAVSAPASRRNSGG